MPLLIQSSQFLLAQRDNRPSSCLRPESVWRNIYQSEGFTPICPRFPGTRNRRIGKYLPCGFYTFSICLFNSSPSRNACNITIWSPHSHVLRINLESHPYDARNQLLFTRISVFVFSPNHELFVRKAFPTHSKHIFQLILFCNLFSTTLRSYDSNKFKRQGLILKQNNCQLLIEL